MLLTPPPFYPNFRGVPVVPDCSCWDGCAENGGSEIGGPEKEGPIIPKVRRWKMEDRKMEDRIWGEVRRRKMGINVSRDLKQFGREIIFEVFQPM